MDAVIREAAVVLLAECGFARLTMEQVAQRAGVSKASVYLRWPNKLALVADALGQRANAVPEAPDTGSLPGDMRAFLSALLVSRAAGSRALAAVSGEIATSRELREAWHKGLAGMLAERLRTIVACAVERGELPQGTDIDLLARLPLALLQSWRAEHGHDPDSDAVERIVRQFYTPAPGRAGSA